MNRDGDMNQCVSHANKANKAIFEFKFFLSFIFRTFLATRVYLRIDVVVVCLLSTAVDAGLKCH